jgi:hypothetical protein
MIKLEGRGKAFGSLALDRLAAAVALHLLATGLVLGQQAATETAPPFATNATYVQGVGPGYWPTAGAGLTLNLAPGTAFCGGAIRTYAGGQLTMAASATNYVYLDATASCAPAVNTSGFSSTTIPIAVVAAGSSAIPPGGITDDRTFFFTGGSGGANGTATALQFGSTVDNLNSTPPTSGQVLTWDGSHISGSTVSGTGTVTSVGLSTDRSWLTVGSSPITGAGTITLNGTTGLTANQFLATPNGSAGTVGLRTIAPADIPTLNQNTTGNAATATALASTPTGCGTNLFANAIAASGNLTCAAALTANGGASHNWLQNVTAAGLFSIGQPASADLSDYGSFPGAAFGSQTANYVYAAPNGSAGNPGFRALAGADLPAPTASTLGGIESITSASHNWVSYIDTSGVPHQSRPAISDLTATFSAPLSLSSNTLSITGAAGQVLAGATPAFTPTPTLGVQGTTAGSLTVAGASTTSGSLTLNGYTSGSSVLTASPTGGYLGIGTTSASAPLQIEDDGITSQTDGLYLRNATAATNGAQQLSPAIHQEGQGWVVLNAPTAPSSATPTSGGSCTAGTHVWAITYLNASGETTAGTSSSSQTCSSSYGTEGLSAIPKGPTGTLYRNVYQSKAGYSTPLYLDCASSPCIGDNSTTTYSATLADGSLGAQSPSSNTTGNSQPVDFGAHIMPVQGTTATGSYWNFWGATNGGSVATLMQLFPPTSLLASGSVEFPGNVGVGGVPGGYALNITGSETLSGALYLGNLGAGNYISTSSNSLSLHQLVDAPLILSGFTARSAAGDLFDFTGTFNSSSCSGPCVMGGIKQNITNTASAAGSFALKLQTGGVTETNIDLNGNESTASYISTGTTFTTNAGCSETSLTGGATAGSFVAGATSCTTTVTMGNSATAPNGWACSVWDLTTTANAFKETATTATSVTLSGTATANDKIVFGCKGF